MQARRISPIGKNGLTPVNDTEAQNDLPKELTLPRTQETQDPTFTLPDVCVLPSTSQLPPPLEHSQYVQESKGVFSVAGLTKLLSNFKKAKREAKTNQRAEGSKS
jgi:hypothetical protein